MSSIVERIRNFQSSAPINVEALIASFGIDLEKKGNLDPEIAGVIELIDPDRYKISVNGSDHYYRRRFTMAHELGHFLFHRDLIGAGIGDNRAYRSTNVGKFNNQNITQNHEIEANKFAAHLLMPGDLIRQYHEECGGDLNELSKKFQVSSEAMGYRLQALGLV